MTRCTSADVTFVHPFRLAGVDGELPPGTYRVDTEEEPIEGLSFLAYRRLATFIRVPVPRSATIQSFLIDPQHLSVAIELDRNSGQPPKAPGAAAQA